MTHTTPRRHRIVAVGAGLLAATALTVGSSVAVAGTGATTASERSAATNVPEVKEERNERIAIAFMELAINDQQPQEAVDRYMGATFVQHNPQNVDGPQAFVAWATGLIAFAPDVNVDIKRTLADGELVSVHSHFTTSPSDRGFAVVDMFRFSDGKIVEHWDVLQTVPATSANDNTMF